MSVESRLRGIEREIDRQPDGRIKPTLAEFVANLAEPGWNRTDEGRGKPAAESHQNPGYRNRTDEGCREAR